MDQNQTFSLTGGIFSGSIAAFIQLVFLLILVYLLLSVLNFLRDKFINKEPGNTKEHIGELLAILNKLFVISGFGFVTANLIEFLFTQGYTNHANTMINFRGAWDHLIFGIILIFVGIGLRRAHQAIETDKQP